MEFKLESTKRHLTTESSECEDKNVDSLKIKKSKLNQQDELLLLSQNITRSSACTSTSLDDETDSTTNILEALLTLATAVRGIQDELSELNNKVDSMVKNITVYNDDEILFLENYWPWKNESQMKKAETDMNEDKTQFNRTIMMLKRIGGHDNHSIITNILKTTIVDGVAILYSWAGKKKKKSFVDTFPTFVKVISVVSRYHCQGLTDEDIKNVVSRWLKQAKLRMFRAEMKQPKAIDDLSSDESS